MTWQMWLCCPGYWDTTTIQLCSIVWCYYTCVADECPLLSNSASLFKAQICYFISPTVMVQYLCNGYSYGSCGGSLLHGLYQIGDWCKDNNRGHFGLTYTPLSAATDVAVSLMKAYYTCGSIIMVSTDIVGISKAEACCVLGLLHIQSCQWGTVSV